MQKIYKFVMELSRFKLFSADAGRKMPSVWGLVQHLKFKQVNKRAGTEGYQVERRHNNYFADDSYGNMKQKKTRVSMCLLFNVFHS